MQYKRRGRWRQQQQCRRVIILSSMCFIYIIITKIIVMMAWALSSSFNMHVPIYLLKIVILRMFHGVTIPWRKTVSRCAYEIIPHNMRFVKICQCTAAVLRNTGKCGCHKSHDRSEYNAALVLLSHCACASVLHTTFITQCVVVYVMDVLVCDSHVVDFSKKHLSFVLCAILSWFYVCCIFA